MSPKPDPQQKHGRQENFGQPLEADDAVPPDAEKVMHPELLGDPAFPPHVVKAASEFLAKLPPEVANHPAMSNIPAGYSPATWLATLVNFVKLLGPKITALAPEVADLFTLLFSGGNFPLPSPIPPPVTGPVAGPIPPAAVSITTGSRGLPPLNIGK